MYNIGRSYSGEAERAIQDIYDDFRLKKTCGLPVYINIFQPFN